MDVSWFVRIPEAGHEGATLTANGFMVSTPSFKSPTTKSLYTPFQASFAWSLYRSLMRPAQQRPDPAVWYYRSHVVNAADVICGKKCERHPGNTDFRKIVSEYKTAYQTTSTRETKKQIIETVIQRVADNSGRFVRESDDLTSMELVPSQYIYEKVSHALRSTRQCKSPTLPAAALLRRHDDTASTSLAEGRPPPPPPPPSETVFAQLLATQQRLFSTSLIAGSHHKTSKHGDGNDDTASSDEYSALLMADTPVQEHNSSDP
jgi:hypothetical protein